MLLFSVASLKNKISYSMWLADLGCALPEIMWPGMISSSDKLTHCSLCPHWFLPMLHWFLLHYYYEKIKLILGVPKHQMSIIGAKTSRTWTKQKNLSYYGQRYYLICVTIFKVLLLSNCTESKSMRTFSQSWCKKVITLMKLKGGEEYQITYSYCNKEKAPAGRGGACL